MIPEFKNKYRWLSNFYPVEITLDGIAYPSVEHAYMSSKSDDTSWKHFCSDVSNSAGTVKKRSREIQLKPEWDNLKLSIMKECINQKYAQEPFRSKLIATGNQHIQEGNWWGDQFWGVCLKSGQGSNHLGKLILSVRDTLLVKNTQFKVIIAGGRDFNNYEFLERVCNYKLQNKTNIEIVSGGAKGADCYGEMYAAENNLPKKVFLADWERYGKSAGPIRNREMAEYADALIAFWDGGSPGTKNMIEVAKELGLGVHVERYVIS